MDNLQLFPEPRIAHFTGDGLDECLSLYGMVIQADQVKWMTVDTWGNPLVWDMRFDKQDGVVIYKNWEQYMKRDRNV